MGRSNIGPIPSPVGDLIEEINGFARRLSTLEAPSGEANGDTVARVQASIDELLARRTIAAEDAYNYLIDAGVDPIPFTTPNLADVAFTLTERRQVHLAVTAGTGILLVHNGTGAIYNPICQVYTRIRLENLTAGTVLNGSSVTELGVGGNAGIVGLARSGARLSHDDYAILDPGDYVASYVGIVQQLTGTQAQVRIYAPKLSVEIMEQAP